MDENEYKAAKLRSWLGFGKTLLAGVFVSIVSLCLNHQIQQAKLELEEYNSQTRYLETFLPSYAGASRGQKLDFLQFMIYANPDTEAVSRYRNFYNILKGELDTINKLYAVIDSLKKEILILKAQIDSINSALETSTIDRKSLLLRKQSLQEKLSHTLKELDIANKKLEKLNPDKPIKQEILTEPINEEQYRLVTSKLWIRNRYEFNEIGLFSDIGIYYPEFEPMKLGIRYAGQEAIITVYGMKSFSLKQNESITFTFDSKTKYKFTLLPPDGTMGGDVLLKIDQYKRK